MIDFSSSYSTEWRLFRVDRRTWADGEPVSGLMSASVTCSLDGSMMQSADISVETDIDTEFEEGYYRLVMAAYQQGLAERVDIATLHCASTTWAQSNGKRLWTLKGRSVLHPAEERKTRPMQYAPAGSNGAEWAARTLGSVCLCPVSWSGGYTLDSNVVFDGGKSLLEAVWMVLDAGGYTIDIDGRGRVSVMPMPTSATVSLEHAGAALLSGDASGGIDMTQVPNMYTAIDGTDVESAVNDDADSQTSVATRGYVSEAYDSSPKRVNGETLAAYCARRLSEASTVKEPRTYTRDWADGVRVGYMVQGSVGTVGTNDALRVESQKVTIGNGVSVEETAYREVRTWR